MSSIKNFFGDQFIRRSLLTALSIQILPLALLYWFFLGASMGLFYWGVAILIINVSFFFYYNFLVYITMPEILNTNLRKKVFAYLNYISFIGIAFVNTFLLADFQQLNILGAIVIISLLIVSFLVHTGKDEAFFKASAWISLILYGFILFGLALMFLHILTVWYTPAIWIVSILAILSFASVRFCLRPFRNINPIPFYIRLFRYLKSIKYTRTKVFWIYFLLVAVFLGWVYINRIHISNPFQGLF